MVILMLYLMFAYAARRSYKDYKQHVKNEYRKIHDDIWNRK